ncbi:MAG: prolipoprotein diacylglyceryl transferase [Ferruginibacter sp.]|nr:prolipoprotein diacylglyceryl transferase [Cytophagales bacterium]
MASPNWIEKLKTRWGVRNAGQVVIILVVFACTGITAMYIKRPVFAWLGVGEATPGWLKALIYIFTVLPAYQVFLLGYGFLFGQFAFFWNFEKRFFGRIGKLFSRK